MKERKVPSLQIIYSILEQEPARRFFPIAEAEETGPAVQGASRLRYAGRHLH